jgi:HK97 family phage portal protein
LGLLKKLFRSVAKKFDGYYSGTYMIAPNLNTADYLKTYGECGWLFACTSKIAQNIADSEWNAVKKDSDGNENVVQSKILDLLMNPNPFTSFYDFFELHQLYLEITGKCYWYIEKDRIGRPQEIYLINPLYMITYPDRDNFIKGYGYRAGVEEIPLNVDEVIFFNFPNPLNPYDGVSPAKAVADSIESHKYATKYNKNFFYNGAEPKGIVTFPDVNDDDYERLKEKWQDQYGGFDNAHKTAFIRGSQVSYTAIQISQKDMDFFNLKVQSRDEIFGSYGVPKSIFGITEDVNRANAETAEYTMAKHVVRPRLRKLQEKLNNEFVPMFKDEEGTILKFLDPVPANKDFIKSVVDSQTDKSITKNEAREILNKLLGTKLKPIEGGNVIYQPISQQPMGTAMPTVSNTSSKEDCNLAEKTPQEPKEPQKNIKSKLQLRLKAKLDNLDKETYWKAFVNKTDKFEKEMQPVWKEIFEHQKDKIVAGIKSHKSIKAIIIEDILKFLSDNEESDYMVEQIMPLLKKIMADKGDQVMDELETNTSFNLHDPKVTEWLDKYCGIQITNINSTTETLIRKQLKQGQGEGESIPKLCDRISQYFDDMEGYRIQTICRTEVISATNQSSLLGYKQSGVVDKKQWLTAIDERTREWHIEADGQTVDLDKNFIVDGEELECPGGMGGSPENVVNCRCTIIAAFD